VARPARTARRQSELDLHDPAAAGRVRAVRRPRRRGADGAQTFPFEVWVNGADQPRGLGAVAKTLSMDMRANDPGWLKLKLDVLARTASDQGFDMPMPPSGEHRRMPGVVAAFAQVIRYRCDKLGALEREAPTPVLDTLFALQEPRTGTDGTLSWTVDISNPATGEDFVLGLKEITLPGGETRPYSVWLSGNYPRALDGLTRILALDMRVMDPAWIGMKLRKLDQLPGTAGRLHGLRARHAPSAELAIDRRLRRPPHHPPLRHAGHPRRSRLPDARNGHPRGAARRRRTETDAGRAVRRMRQPPSSARTAAISARPAARWGAAAEEARPGGAPAPRRRTCLHEFRRRASCTITMIQSLLRIAACVVLSIAVALLAPDDPALRAALAIFALAGSLWMTQALPLTLTALLVPLLAVLFAGVTPSKALASFAHPIIFLFLGGFALAAALARHGLDRWLARRVLALSGGRRVSSLALLFALTALLSMWISNTATAAMMLPLALGLLGPDADPRERTFVLLGVAYSASIGGIGTLVGSPPNAIAAAQAGIGFAEWMRFGLPLVFVLVPLMAATLWLVLRPALGGRIELPAAEADDRWTPGRIATASVFAFAVAGWVFGAPLARALGVEQDIDAVVALAVIVLLVASRAIDWPDIESHTQWGVLLLFGGGLALSALMGSSGASRFLADALTDLLRGTPDWLVLLGIIAFVVMLTELVSNTASAALLVPVFAVLAPDFGLDPRALSAAIAISASCAFMLPVATPPNALVFGTGHVSAASMMRCGLLLNGVCIGVITLYAHVL
jgi:sodium-dependent dicarboxylate transporter 2/3/5